VLVFSLLLAACSNGSTGGGSKPTPTPIPTPTPGEPQVETYVGVADGVTYILKITENTGVTQNLARYAAKKGDTYVLTIGADRSEGTVDKVESGGKYTLKPRVVQNEQEIAAPSFTVTVDTAQSGITAMSGTITTSDNTTKPAPAAIKPSGGVNDDGFFYSDDGANITIVVYRGTALNVTIPSTINSKPVTSIGWGAFTKTKITGAVIPNSVTTIGDEAFEECKSLASVTIGNGVKDIGSCAFRYCTSLTGVTIPDSVDSIGWAVFHGCTSLSSVTLPNKDFLKGYSGNAFSDCTSLKSITIPSNVTQIPFNTFNGCTSLTSVNIPSGVTSIGSWAFLNCKITNITIPGGITKIEDGTFTGCGNITSINIPSGVTSIGYWAFTGCNITSITIPSSVASIKEGAFYCDNLTSVTFQGAISASSLDYYAFSSSYNDESYNDLRDKYLAGGIGTYTRAFGDWEWTKQ
jgi:hypothetical protein